MATATSSTAESNSTTEGPVLNLINKRLRALRKKLNRILQMEESVAQGKSLNKEQEEVLRSKPSVVASIEELEKLKQPLSAAVSEEVQLALSQNQNQNPNPSPNNSNDSNNVDVSFIEDLLNLLYFGSLFDVKSQNEFSATILTRTHERGCCLTYDYVTDDANDELLLGERDLDLISKLSGLLISRPVDSSLSHKNALFKCIEHAKLWLSNSDQLIEPNANVSYGGLRERLNKIMTSDYFTTTPEMKAPVEVAAAAAGNYASFQVSVHGVVPVSVPVLVEGSNEHYQEDEETANFKGQEIGDNHSSPPEEYQKDEPESEIPTEDVPGDQEQPRSPEAENTQKEADPKEQPHGNRRSYQNQRGGRGGSGGGRRGYSNGRGGRSNGRGGGGGYQNGRNQSYDNYHQRNYYNNRGRGGRGGGHPYNNNGSGVHGGQGPSNVGVTS